MRALQRFRDTHPAVGDYEHDAEPLFVNVRGAQESLPEDSWTP